MNKIDLIQSTMKILGGVLLMVSSEQYRGRKASTPSWTWRVTLILGLIVGAGGFLYE